MSSHRRQSPVTKPAPTVREDAYASSSPRNVRSSSALLPLLVLIALGVTLWLLDSRRDLPVVVPAPQPPQTEDEESAERKRDLARVREDFLRNQPPPVDGIARYQENVQ